MIWGCRCNLWARSSWRFLCKKLPHLRGISCLGLRALWVTVCPVTLAKPLVEAGTPHLRGIHRRAAHKSYQTVPVSIVCASILFRICPTFVIIPSSTIITNSYIEISWTGLGRPTGMRSASASPRMRGTRCLSVLGLV